MFYMETVEKERESGLINKRITSARIINYQIVTQRAVKNIDLDSFIDDLCRVEKVKV